MAKNTSVDDPFNDDDWGMGGSGSMSAASDEMPDAVTDADRLPFLTPRILKEDKGALEMVGISNDPGQYSDVAIVVKYKNTNFRLGFKLFSPDYIRLQKRFGKKKTDWHGPLNYRVMPHKGNPRGYVAVR